MPVPVETWLETRAPAYNAHTGELALRATPTAVSMAAQCGRRMVVQVRPRRLVGAVLATGRWTRPTATQAVTEPPGFMDRLSSLVNCVDVS